MSFLVRLKFSQWYIKVIIEFWILTDIFFYVLTYFIDKISFEGRCSMQVFIHKIQSKLEGNVTFNIHKLNPYLNAIIDSLKNESGNSYLLVTQSETKKTLKLSFFDIYYLEYVDRTVFVYTADTVYETKEPLYKLQEQVPSCIIRCSKSMLVNLSKIKEFRSCLNGNLLAKLLNNEEINISRRYVKSIKLYLKEIT